MGIRVTCPNGHKLHVKAFLAGKRCVCPKCGASTLIPTEQQPPPATVPLPADRHHFDRLDTTSSVIISVAEAPVTMIAINDMAPAIQPVQSTPTAPDVDAPATQPDSSVIVEPVVPVSPAINYVARRARNRRNQLTITIALLVAVIVLAVVLIWVLQRGGGPTSAAMAAPNHLVDQVESL